MLQLGSSGYVFEWLACAKKFVGKWGNVKVCPLIPVWGGALPGRFHRILLEINAAFKSLYGEDPRGLRAAWDALEDQLKTLHHSHISPQLVPDTYTLPFPASLSGPLTVKNRTFVTHYSCPATLNPVSCKAKYNLVRLLAAELNGSLAAGIDLAGISEKNDTGCEAEAKGENSPPPQFAIFGSSHMRRTAAQLVAKGYRVMDLTQKSWFLNKKSVEALTNTLQSARIPADTFLILDLFGNTSTKFRQADDTLALATKVGGEGGWHMLGEVVATPDAFLMDQVGSLGGMLASIKNHLKIVFPPIPCYVFGSCCNDTSHAPNVSSPTHITSSLTEHIRQRSTIIRKLHDHKTQHFKVIDVLSIFAQTSASIADKGTGLKSHTHRDNVHLTENGYKLVADAIISEAKLLRDRVNPPSKPNTNSAGVKGSELRVWGGFYCTAGYGKTASTTNKLYRGGGGQRHHPYRR